MEEAGWVARGRRGGDGLLVESFWGMHGVESPRWWVSTSRCCWRWVAAALLLLLVHDFGEVG